VPSGGDLCDRLRLGVFLREHPFFVVDEVEVFEVAWERGAPRCILMVETVEQLDIVVLKHLECEVDVFVENQLLQESAEV
jgi:hypothetical protein